MTGLPELADEDEEDDDLKPRTEDKPDAEKGEKVDFSDFASMFSPSDSKKTAALRRMRSRVAKAKARRAKALRAKIRKLRLLRAKRLRAARHRV